jgi:hypothetical protein
MRSTRWVLLVVATAFAGCGVPIESGAHFASGWQPPPRTTFAWNDAADRTRGDVRLEDNALFHTLLHEAVEWELNLRGIRYAETNPALLIHHHFSLADHVMENEVIDQEGNRSSETYVYEGGSVVLHIVDTRDASDAWVAWAQANVEPALTSPAAMRRWVYALVGQMFENWPLPPRAVDE